MMATGDERELEQEIAETAGALRAITDDETEFRLLVEAFRAQDHQTFRAVLRRFDLLDHCNLVCRWLCSKECVLLCLRLAGPPPKEPPDVSLRTFADVVTKITADPDSLRRLASAVLERDEQAFGAVLEHLGLRPFAHFICRWICAVRCRLVCQLLCRVERPAYLIGCTHLVTALQQAGGAVARLAANERALAVVEKGVLAWDCEIVREALERAGLRGVCQWVCEWICAWRCVRVCFRLCLAFPLAEVDDELQEIHEFGRVLAAFADRREPLVQLAAAIEAEDVERYTELVRQHGVERYCLQLCHWLCDLVCRRYCRCVCPPPRPRPWFTHVGHFHIYGDIDAADGLTNKAVLGHGGPDYGFFGCMELRGFCPGTSPTFPGVPMRYRFLYEHGGSRSPLVGAFLCPVIVGSRTIFWDVDGTGLEETFQTVMIAGSGATPDPTPPPVVPPGTAWGPPPTHVIVPDADGWISVDPDALGGAFSGALLGFNSPAAFPGGAATTSATAGSQVPAAELREGVDIAIVFEATRVGGPTSPPDYANTLGRIHINNWQEVRLLDLLQFHTGGGNPCSPLFTDLDIEYTVDHELMLGWDINIVTAAGITVPPLPSGTATRSGGVHTAFGTHHEDVSAWPTCSYTVVLSSQRALTTGLFDDDKSQTAKTFCIGRSPRRPERDS